MANKKVVLGILVTVLAFGMTGIGCDNGNNSNEELKDSILIRSVTPSSGLIDGKETQLTIIVDYNLATLNQGEIQIAFNNGDYIDGTLSYDLPGFRAQINNGSGAISLAPSVIPKNWGNEGNFVVRAYLYAYPHGNFYQALAWSNDTILTFGN